VRRPKPEWVSTKASEEAALLASRYTWELTGGFILDPTDALGQLPDVVTGFGGLIRIPTLMARVNEPAPAADTNLVARISESAVEYVTERGEMRSAAALMCGSAALLTRPRRACRQTSTAARNFS
jgi:hypothetical protein